MAKLTLSLACGHEVERTLRGHQLPHLDGVHVACLQCKRLHPVDRVEVHADDAPGDDSP